MSSYLSFALVILSLAAALCGCRFAGQQYPGTTGVSTPPGIYGGGTAVEQADTCGRVIAEIESARYVSIELQSFGWKEFSNIGWSSPEQGMCAVTPQGYTYRDSGLWTSLADYLPPQVTARTLTTSCDNCLDLANTICRDKTLTAYSRADNATVNLRLNSWKRLEAALTAAEFSARNRGTLVKSAVFAPVEGHFSSTDEDIRQAYYPLYREKSAKFILLHERMADKLGAARQVVSGLTGSSSAVPVEQEIGGGQ
ncbi:MAG: hypothetical protein NT177_07305 [Chloroflexi bacterium]|jgi:hypothetical protein|nr:hypothetical protein [Chloroflexota bacterium]